MNDYDFKCSSDELPANVKKWVDRFYQYTYMSGMLSLWRRSYYQFYSGYFMAGQIQVTGDDGELVDININDYRTLLKHVAIQITSSDLNWDVRSINTDEKSQKQAVIIPALLEYYEKFGGASKESYKLVEYSLVYGASHMVTEWDLFGGDIYDHTPTDAKGFAGEQMKINLPVRTGDLKYRAYAPIDVVFDVGLKSMVNNNWYVVRDWIDKYSLAEKYPAKKDEIINLKYTYNFMRDIDEFIYVRRETDVVPFWTFYHKPTPSLPYGRKAVMAGGDCDVLCEDSMLPYDSVPLATMMPCELERTPFGYTDAFDILPLQRAKNILYSIILSNQMMFGVSNVLVPEGTSITKDQLEKGLNVIKYPPGSEKPSVLNLTYTPPEVQRMPGELSMEMQKQFAISPVSLGQPQEGITAGNAMALLDAQSIQFSSQIQKSYIQAREKSAYSTVDVLIKMLPTEKMIGIEGKVAGQYINSFKPDDLKGVHRIILNPGNPTASTPTSRMAQANNLLQYGAITDPAMYYQVLQTGRVESATEGRTAENLQLKSDQDMLLSGQLPPALWTDNHVRYIQMAKDMLCMPDVRNNPQILPVVMQYIQEHVDLSLNTDPMKLLAVGLKPIINMPPPGGPGAPPGGPQAPPMNGHPPPPMQKGGNPQPTDAAFTNGVHPPTNPETKQKWNPQTGG